MPLQVIYEAAYQHDECLGVGDAMREGGLDTSQ